MTVNIWNGGKEIDSIDTSRGFDSWTQVSLSLFLYFSLVFNVAAVTHLYTSYIITAARLAQWDKHRSTEREAVGSNPGRTNTQGL